MNSFLNDVCGKESEGWKGRHSRSAPHGPRPWRVLGIGTHRGIGGCIDHHPGLELNAGGLSNFSVGRPVVLRMPTGVVVLKTTGGVVVLKTTGGVVVLKLAGGVVDFS